MDRLFYSVESVNYKETTKKKIESQNKLDFS